ncbi:NAD-glutamate dehydrogenase [Terasakiella sp. A23]|uniref:NAD-glutamate dehydrogenase domain-containing protein n=1 Tax=Terasakiella sp. FCG-A23 TaxID=3080561 RepID=UPI002955BD34|nr:NAD-glutamate dehydrogenase domain-containing protein [Terasakiella sp. A23]MDV7339173.1 NAD-glutamate dehydrogenase [Terasakiella sp. A23]
MDKQPHNSLDEFVTNWTDAFRSKLEYLVDVDTATSLFDQFNSMMSISFRDQTEPARAAADVFELHHLEIDGGIGVELISDAETNPMVLKVLSAGDELFLSDVLPVIENLGFKVHDEHSFKFQSVDRLYSVCNFDVSTKDIAISDESTVCPDIATTIKNVLQGRVENDCFNKLILTAGLRYFDVVLVRALAKYLKQINIPFSENYMERALSENPVITAKLVQLFHYLFNPDVIAEEAGITQRKSEIAALLDEVTNADQDRILRHFENLISAILRTNFFQKANDGTRAPYLCFKLKSAAIDGMPRPTPWREIWVYSPRIEGVHLRGGPVARGGLRWSDRHEDFRTEILGLVKAQQVKNTVIVPVGSKGGFVAKQLQGLSDRAAIQEEGVACYQQFITALLDITDNRKGDEIIPPSGVVCLDDPDPYLVVAADKGTATFSDIANAISVSKGFWMGDAFASGGSAGYDHKKMGITARGAWESVKRHFNEMGKNIQKENFTVVGIGDMGGDVFGNGMLLSHHIQLVAAFNHKHIFIDPKPDADISWQERKRLFDAVKGWDDYDRDLISKGGGVFLRTAKTIAISAEMKTLLSITEDSLTPNALIQHILKSEAELMWFGGIGTYIKAASENNLDVGDKANDSLRINADELSCKVIGEGANLGLTQLGRIEYGLNGGRLNTDSIDNAAGVDCSDHEVNLKILLGAAVKDKRLDEEARDKLLSDMTNDVARLVLKNNYHQTQALSLYEFPGTSVLDDQLRLLNVFDNAELLARDLEALPSDRQIIAKVQRSEALTRPEIAIMMSYSKIWLLDEVLKCDFIQSGCLIYDYLDYFPAQLRAKYEADMLNHPLKNEILATVLTNELVNRIGGNFVARVMERSGQTAQRVIQAFFVCRDIFGLKGLWKSIEDLDQKTNFKCQMRLLAILNRSIEQCVLWLMKEGRLERRHGEVVNQYKPRVFGVREKIAEKLDKDERQLLGGELLNLSTRGVPDAVLMEMALVGLNTAALDVTKIIEEMNCKNDAACDVFLGAGRTYKLNVLRSHIQNLKPTSKWQKLSIAALLDDVSLIQAALTREGLSPLDAKKVSVNDHPRKSRFANLINEINAAETPDYFLLSLACRQLGALV